MNKITRRTKIVLISMTVLLVVTVTIFVFIHYSKKCGEIIGDGYAMGIDPEPVVIGNTCDE